MTMNDTDHARDIHTFFGLSYSNYLVLPRTLLQSMPEEWQHRFTGMLDEMSAAFDHVPQADFYKVEAATEHEVSDLTGEQLKALGIAVEDGPCGEDHDCDADEGVNCWPIRVYTELPSGRQMGSWERVLIPVPDPVPSYNRGRTYIEPR